MSIDVKLTPTQARIVKSLEDGPQSKFEIEKFLGKDLAGCSESLVKTQVCLINQKYEKKVIESFFDSYDGINKYRLLEHNIHYQIGKEIGEIHQLIELVVSNTETNQLLLKSNKNMETKVFILTLLISAVIFIAIGFFSHMIFWNAEYRITNDNTSWQQLLENQVEQLSGNQMEQP